MTKIQTFFTDAARFLVDPANKKNPQPAIAWTVTIILGTFMAGIPQILSEAWRHFQQEEENVTHKKIKQIIQNLFGTESDKTKALEVRTDALPVDVPSAPSSSKRSKIPATSLSSIASSLSNSNAAALNTPLLNPTKKSESPKTSEKKEEQPLFPPKVLDIKPPLPDEKKEKATPSLPKIQAQLSLIFEEAPSFDNACSLANTLQESLENAILDHVLSILDDPDTNIQKILNTSIEVIHKQASLKKMKKMGGGGNIRQWIAISEESLLKSLSKKCLDKTLNEEPLIEDPSENEAFAQLAQLIAVLKRSYPENNSAKILLIFQQAIDAYIKKIQADIKKLNLTCFQAASLKKLEVVGEMLERLILTILTDKDLLYASKGPLESISIDISDELKTHIKNMHKAFLRRTTHDEDNSLYAKLNGLLLVLANYHEKLGIPNELEQTGKIVNRWGMSITIFKNVIALQTLNPSKIAVAQAIIPLITWTETHINKQPSIESFLNCLEAAIEPIKNFNLLKLENRDLLLGCYMANLRAAISKASKLISSIERIDQNMSQDIQKIDIQLKKLLDMNLNYGIA